MAEEDGGLFSIAIDDSDEEGLISEAAAKAKERPRDWQSEEDFQELKATYRVNVQNGDVSHFMLFFLPSSRLHFHLAISNVIGTPGLA
ncbi:hypothetical protein LZ30DRAFT_723831 [Colletotrichum cereale]|nr:hypothetical protein LZ30DRAFT_723831 [Colletotrichum cereale]